MKVLRYAAFTRTPEGGNPAGVVLDATGVADEILQATAAEVGYSETAFLVPRRAATGEADVRYFSPRAEVPFCGHATIAAAVAHAEYHGPGRLLLHTRAGPVAVVSSVAPDGRLTATLTSVPPATRALDPNDLSTLLRLLRWSTHDLDPSLPPRVAFAGAWHPVLAAASRERLADLAYDVLSLGELMADRGWTTLQLVWRESATVFHAPWWGRRGPGDRSRRRRPGRVSARTEPCGRARDTHDPPGSRPRPTLPPDGGRPCPAWKRHRGDRHSRCDPVAGVSDEGRHDCRPRPLACHPPLSVTRHP